MRFVTGIIVGFLNLILLGGVLSAAPPLNSAQHHEHGGMPEGHSPAPHDEAQIRLFQSDMATMVGMTPRDAMGDTVPSWRLMTMGVFRLVYNRQGGESGDEAVESSNWGMAMVHRPLGSGRITLMLMSSLEPATFPERGSPQLFQTGESFEGEPLVDRQHAHDFFMNLSATYRIALSTDSAAWIQLAPAGEPALGPTAFMHRASSGENPSAPIGHHWEDSTHITWNVVTAGGGWRAIVLEASTFHGREPDEERWDIDGGGLDSASGRLKLLLGRGYSAHISHGYLHNPETLEEGDTHRTTASFNFGAAGDRPIALTLLWGRNREEHGTSDAFLVEGAWQMTGVDQTFARFERVEKDMELLATKQLPEHEQGGSPALADIAAFTVGYLRDFGRLWGITGGLGGDGTVYAMPDELEPVYGEFPVSVHAFLRARWGEAHGHARHGEMGPKGEESGGGHGGH